MDRSEQFRECGYLWLLVLEQELDNEILEVDQRTKGYPKEKQRSHTLTVEQPRSYSGAAIHLQSSSHAVTVEQSHMHTHLY